MKKNLIIIFCLSFLSLFFHTTVIRAYEKNDTDIVSVIFELSKGNNEYRILNSDDKDVSKEFLEWYHSQENAGNDTVIDYLCDNCLSICHIETGNTDSNENLKGFSTKTVTKTYVDRITRLINGESKSLKFTTTLRGTISYNVNTYEVVSVYGTSMTTVYTGNLIMFAEFYASNYSIQTSIPSDHSYGQVRGSCNVYVTEYPGTLGETTRNLGTLTHTLKIYGD